MSQQPPTAAESARRRAWRNWLLLVALLALLAAGVVALIHAARSEAGTRWLLGHVPGLTVSGVQGSLVGESLRIESLQWRGSATQPVLQIDGIELQQPQWRLLPFAGGWVGLSARALTASRVAFTSPRESTPSSGAPPPLHWPLALRIDTVTVAELRLDDAAPWLDVQGSVQLGDNDGAEHRIQGLSLHNDRLQLSADARIGTTAPLPLALQLQAKPVSGIAWQATVNAEGPLTEFVVRASLRGDQRNADAPTLDVLARIAPFTNWPLASLQLSTRALDLAALSSAAPRTRIDAQANVQSAGLDRPAQASVHVQNHEPGRWDSGRIPMREVQLELGGTPSKLDRIEIQQLDATLADERRAAGRVQGRGQWAGSELQLQLQLTDVEPTRLHASAPPLRAGGALNLQLSGVPLPGGANAPAPNAPATGAPWQARVDGALDGTLGGSAQALHAQFKLTATADAVELTQLRATAGEASAQAALKAQRQRAGSQLVWRLAGDGELNQFDPLPWWPGAAGTAWARGPHRINGRWQIDLQIPESLGEQWRRQRESALAALRGQLQLDLADSVLAGLPMTARVEVHGDGQALGVRASWSAAGNQATLAGRLAVDAAQDHWQLDGALPALAALQPLSSLMPASAASWPRAGGLTLQAQLDGRWPRLRGGSGSLQANGLQAGELGLAEGLARWQFGGSDDAPLAIMLDAKGLQQGTQRVDAAQARVDGSLRAHRITAQLETPARPPAWSENLVGTTSTGTRATLEAQGGWRAEPAGGGRWHADDGSLRVVVREGKGDPWLDIKRLQGELAFDAHGALTQALLSPGRALFAGGATLRWSEAAWRADGQRLDLRAELEPLAVAPLLARLQPDIGWGGDLTLAGRIDVHAAERFEAEIVLARSGGDLHIADESGVATALGIDELQLAFVAHEGTWRFAQGLAGRQIGEMAGAQVVRTNARSRWPAADSGLEGVLQLRVANLGAWGVWVPPGWRLGGNLHMNASLGGHFSGPELRGSVQGSELSVRNVLQGIGVSDGELMASLEGERVRVQRLSFKGGDGTLNLTGEATLGDAPSAKLQLAAERFRLLGRVDRRVITSGNAQLQFNRDALQLDGKFDIDEGLIDFSKTSAPGLDNDVSVVRGASAAGDAGARDPRAAAQPTPAPLRNAQVNLAVALGDKLHIRGHGLDAMLRGDLRLTTPGGRPALNGSVRAEQGTYVAYAQKLVIERGELIFTGAIDNPRLDILAVRPNLDVRVGVAVTGLLSNLHVRLFSDPEMAEMDKLSWLMLGRPSEGLGRNDTALVQRAALALLSGEEQTPTDQLLNQLGLTDFSVRQGDTETRETIVSLGRQLSQRWYVGYERSVNTTTGTWQLIYRIAQRFTVRAQSGADNSLDFIWQWRW